MTERTENEKRAVEFLAQWSLGADDEMVVRALGAILDAAEKRGEDTGVCSRNHES